MTGTKGQIAGGVDREIRDFIEQAPAEMTHSELGAAIAHRSGRERAWTRNQIIRFSLFALERRHRQSRIEQDPALLAFIEDRIGRFALADLLTECRRKFGEARVPSRSALYRYAMRFKAN